MKAFYLFLCIVLGFIARAQDTLTVQAADSITYIPARTDSRTQEVYKIRKGVDIPIFLVAGGWSGYALTQIYSKDPSTDEQIQQLSRYDVARFNRRAIDHYDLKAKDFGDLFFYGSMPLPIVLMLDKKIRRDAGKIGFLYLETMTITGLPYTASVYFHDKYRPYAYNQNVPMSTRKRGGAKNSFYAGHVALVGTSTFFVAKVYSDYHPHSGINWLFFTLAAGATGTVAYTRYAGGQHFPTDVLIGVIMGPLTGILVPHFHKNKMPGEKGLTILPVVGQMTGFSATYQF